MSTTNPPPSDQTPYHLMPLAAIFFTYTLAATLHLLHLLLTTLTTPPPPTTTTPNPILRPHAPSTLKPSSPSTLSRLSTLLLSPSFLPLVVSTVVSGLGYGATTARVNRFMSGAEVVLHPDGWPVLEFAVPRWLWKPEGDVAPVLIGLYVLFFLGLVYLFLRKRSSSDDGASPDTATKKGRDDGAASQDSATATATPEPRRNLQDQTVAADDVTYLSRLLRPDSTPLHILLYLATTPESLRLTSNHLKIADGMKERRIAYLKKLQDPPSTDTAEAERKAKEEAEATATAASSATQQENDDFGLQSGGWASSDEDSDDEDVQAARRTQREKTLLANQVAEASGRGIAAKQESEDEVLEKMRIEGVDEGVLGQGWVEGVLEGVGQWPPRIGEGMMVGVVGGGEGEGGKVGVMESREARRNLCMVLGRLNAQILNTHPELVAAGQKQQIDLTYFKATMEFRQRTGILLEAALRVAAMTRSYRLYRTVVETAAMFKIGAISATNKKTIKWFQTAMTKTYGDEDGIPRVELGGKTLRRFVKGEGGGGEGGGDDGVVVEEKDEEICGGDPLVLDIEVDRLHAEKFLKHKMTMAMKQGIDPKMVLGMGAYRELWWILVRAKRVSDGDDGDGDDDNIDKNDDDDAGAEQKFLNTLDEETRKIFAAERDENRLLTAWPLIVQSIAQKKGNVKVRFPAPSRPGKYEFLVDVKSQEFFGCDQSFTIEKEVVERK